MQRHALAVCERGSAIDVDRRLSGAGLPAANCQIAITRINLDSSCYASSSLSSEKDRSATAERVKNEIISTRTVPDCIGNQADRLWRGVISLCAGSLDRAGGVLPDVGSCATMLSELEVVHVLAAAALPDKSQLVPGAIKAAEPATRFDPNAQVFELDEIRLTRIEHLRHMPPIHECRAKRPWSRVVPNLPKDVAEKGGEFGLVHFAGGKSKLSVMNTAVPGGVTVDFDIIWWIRDGISGLFAGHQPLIGDLVSGIAAKKQVRSGAPTIAGLGHNLARIIFGANIVGVLSVGMLSVEQRVDFARIEAGQLEVKIQVGQFLQLEGQDVLGPARRLGQLIVSQNKRPLFGCVEMLDSERRYPFKPQ